MKIIGIDEVGYGCWAGPLVICALKFNEELNFPVFDSKAISAKKREEIYEKLKNIASWHIEFGAVDDINQFGLAAAYKNTLLKCAAKFEKDGEIFLDGRKPKYLECTAIVKGDQKIPEISAASIVAKVIRDNLMIELDSKYEKYNFKNNKGYGTKDHIDALKNYGFCEIHRTCYNLGKYL